MFDLTVATAHTYFVGGHQWLVHNCGENISTDRWDLEFPEEPSIRAV